MSLFSVVLAPFAGAYYFSGIGQGGWPVEALPEGASDQCSVHGVVSAYASMDIFQ
jgi:hypothetical protein